MPSNDLNNKMEENKEKLATASAAAIIGIACSIWLFLEAILFLSFGEIFTSELAPILSHISVLAALLNFIFGALEIAGAILIYRSKYIIGGVIVILTSAGSVIAGGGFYISFLWGLGVGLIALICPKLEKRILESEYSI